MTKELNYAVTEFIEDFGMYGTVLNSGERLSIYEICEKAYQAGLKKRRMNKEKKRKTNTND